jgi:hypothetical protein
MADDYERNINSYTPFQGTNSQWLNMGATYALGNDGTAHIGGLRSDVTSLQHRFSQFADYQAMNNVLAMSPTRQPSGQAIAAGVGAVMAAGGHEISPNQVAAINSGTNFIYDLARQITGAGQTYRMGMDIASGGADYNNSVIALQHQYKRGYDHNTGGDISAANIQTMAGSMHERIFGDPNSPNPYGLMGSGAADLTPMLEYLSRHGAINLSADAGVFGNNSALISKLQQGGEVGKQAERALVAAGVDDETINDLATNAANIMPDNAQAVAAKASGVRIADQVKSLKNLEGIFKSLVDPENVRGINDMLLSMEKFQTTFGSQLSTKDQGRVVSQAIAAMKPLGMGAGEFESLVQQSQAVSQSLGVNGALGVLNMPQTAAELSHFRKEGYGGAGTYGAFSEGQLTKASATLNQGYELGDKMAALGAIAELGSIDPETFDTSTESGRKLKQAVDDLNNGIMPQDPTIRNANADDLKSMVLTGLKNGGERLVDIDRRMTSDGWREQNAAKFAPIAAEFSREDTRREFMRRQQEDLAEYANEFTSSPEQAKKAAKHISERIAEVPAEVAKKGSVAIREFIAAEVMGTDEAELFGKTAAEQRGNIGRMVGNAELHSQEYKHIFGTSLTNQIALFSEDSINGTAKNRIDAEVKAFAEDATRGLPVQDATDAARRFSAGLQAQLDSGKPVNLTALVESATGSMTGGDAKGREALMKSLSTMGERYLEEQQKLDNITNPADRRVQEYKVGKLKDMFNNLSDFNDTKAGKALLDDAARPEQAVVSQMRTQTTEDTGWGRWAMKLIDSGNPSSQAMRAVGLPTLGDILYPEPEQPAQPAPAAQQAEPAKDGWFTWAAKKTMALNDLINPSSQALKSMGLPTLGEIVFTEEAAATTTAQHAGSQQASTGDITMTGTPVFNNLQLVFDGYTISADNVKAQQFAGKAIS